MSKLAIFGIPVTSFSDAFFMAEKIAKSDFVPKDKRGKPIDCLLAMQYAQDVGLEPLYGLQNIAVISGKPTLYGDALLALAKKHPDFISCDEKIDGEGDNMIAVCTITRTNHQPIVRTFSVDDAKLAKLWQKKGKFGDSVWVTYPKRMLQMRARGFAVRDAFPDALAGLISAEEAQDYGSKPIDVTPSPVSQTPPSEPLPERRLPSGTVDSSALEALGEIKFQEAVSFVTANPPKVEAVIAKLELKYAVSESEKLELRQFATQAADSFASDQEGE